MILARFNYLVTVVSGGQGALDALEKASSFDLIVTDVRMPVMNGIESLKAIREKREASHLPPIPEVIITAYDDETILEEAKRLQVCGFVRKPFNIEQFVDLLNRAIETPEAAKQAFLRESHSPA